MTKEEAAVASCDARLALREAIKKSAAFPTNEEMHNFSEEERLATMIEMGKAGLAFRKAFLADNLALETYWLKATESKQ